MSLPEDDTQSLISGPKRPLRSSKPSANGNTLFRIIIQIQVELCWTQWQKRLYVRLFNAVTCNLNGCIACLQSVSFVQVELFEHDGINTATLMQGWKTKMGLLSRMLQYCGQWAGSLVIIAFILPCHLPWWWTAIELKPQRPQQLDGTLCPAWNTVKWTPLLVTCPPQKPWQCGTMSTKLLKHEMKIFSGVAYSESSNAATFLHRFSILSMACPEYEQLGLRETSMHAGQHQAPIAPSSKRLVMCGVMPGSQSSIWRDRTAREPECFGMIRAKSAPVSIHDLT